jgi:hypothetical protein
VHCPLCGGFDGVSNLRGLGGDCLSARLGVGDRPRPLYLRRRSYAIRFGSLLGLQPIGFRRHDGGDCRFLRLFVRLDELNLFGALGLLNFAYGEYRFFGLDRRDFRF